jgi:hypothetical protein
MLEAVRSSETLVLTRATWRNIPEDGILYIRVIQIVKSSANKAGSEKEKWDIHIYIYVHA